MTFPATQSSPRDCFQITLGSQKLSLGRQTKIMGIINMTPDSFSGDGCLRNSLVVQDQALQLADKLIKEGADILDVGGESSRPGSKRISVQEELKRIIPFVKALSSKVKIPVSVDTYKPRVVQEALDAGARIINTIKGINMDKSLLKMVKRYKACIVLMHMKGTPLTMQRNIRTKNLMGGILESLRKSIEICFEIGINSDKIIIDPGIGFGKTVEHNLEIINHLDKLKILRQPILIGPSRKSFIGEILNKGVNDRLVGTIVSVCSSVLRGAHIVRVHDVKAVKEAVLMTDAILN